MKLNSPESIWPVYQLLHLTREVKIANESDILDSKTLSQPLFHLLSKTFKGDRIIDKNFPDYLWFAADITAGTKTS